MERAKIVEVVFAEKILECQRNSQKIKSINETMKELLEVRKRAEAEKNEIHRNYDTKGLEFASIEDKHDTAKRENK